MVKRILFYRFFIILCPFLAESCFQRYYLMQPRILCCYSHLWIRVLHSHTFSFFNIVDYINIVGYINSLAIVLTHWKQLFHFYQTKCLLKIWNCCKINDFITHDATVPCLSVFLLFFFFFFFFLIGINSMQG